MQTRRNIIARCALAALPLIGAGLGANAATAYPDHPIRMIVGFPAGQSSDTTARLIASKLSDALKQSVFVDNRPGAAGIISHEAVKNAAPDGYTLLMGSTGTLAINPFLYKKLPYDALKDLDPVATVNAAPLILFTAASSPFNNLKELAAYTQAHPGKVSYGTGGSGTTGHIAMEMLKKDAGLDLLHVPYKGSPPMITDVIGGQVNVAFEPAGSVLPFGKSARIKFLGIATLKRYPLAPEIPTLSEQGAKGFEATPWSAIMAPKGTPPAIVEQLNAAVNKALKDPVVIEEIAKTGGTPLPKSVAEFRQFLQDENTRWGRAVRDSGAQVD
ncbi:MAG: tripartite tricarboxylate transporter substrate binding protein [Variovorax sp.]|nr:MAG: tripartite tricarboxylate transporter substrate binding protein [Variovorax sp.]